MYIDPGDGKEKIVEVTVTFISQCLSLSRLALDEPMPIESNSSRAGPLVGLPLVQYQLARTLPVRVHPSGNSSSPS